MRTSLGEEGGEPLILIARLALLSEVAIRLDTVLETVQL